MTVDTIKQYTEELKSIDATSFSSEVSYKLAEFTGIARVLSDMYKDNAECNAAIKEFQKVFAEVSGTHSTNLLDKMKKEVESFAHLAKTVENREAFQKDKLASVKGTVTQLFQDQLLPYIENIEQNPNMSEAEKLKEIKDMTNIVLKKSDCSMSYYNKKMQYIDSCTSVAEIKSTIQRSIQNGKNYK
jgi:hypothetical protein